MKVWLTTATNLIVNCNRHGGQEVYHIHMHLLGGRPLGPMLAHKQRAKSMRAAYSGVLVLAALLAGCSSHPEIPVGEQQTLVMESSVLAAGISADPPSVTASKFRPPLPQDYLMNGKSPLPCTTVFLV